MAKRKTITSAIPENSNEWKNPRILKADDNSPFLDTAGDIAGNYRLIEIIGEGTTGVVWKVEHIQSQHLAALKRLRPEFSHIESVQQRFSNEARSLSVIQHPGVVEVFGYSQLSDGTPYIVMELLDGRNLQELLQQAGAFPVRDALVLALQIGAGLQAVHNLGIVHRDLKPANIIIVCDDLAVEGIRAKILDFGVAKSHPSDLDDPLTLDGEILGTPAYMSPEQYQRAKLADSRSDIYAFGCILYQMLSGIAPFTGSTKEVLTAQVYSSPTPICEHVSTIPQLLASTVMRCLEKDPINRCQSVSEILKPLLVVFARSRARPQCRLHRTEGSEVSTHCVAEPHDQDTETQNMEEMISSELTVPLGNLELTLSGGVDKIQQRAVVVPLEREPTMNWSLLSIGTCFAIVVPFLLFAVYLLV